MAHTQAAMTDPLNVHEQAYVLALVSAHVRSGTEYCSVVAPYTVMRVVAGKLVLVRVGGHCRRKAFYTHLLRSLKCTCKFEDL